MTRKELSEWLNSAADKTWIVVLPKPLWSGPSSFVKQDGEWDDPDTLKHLWSAYKFRAVAMFGEAPLRVRGYIW